jgi:hypothetical protein
MPLVLAGFGRSGLGGPSRRQRSTTQSAAPRSSPSRAACCAWIFPNRLQNSPPWKDVTPEKGSVGPSRYGGTTGDSAGGCGCGGGRARTDRPVPGRLRGGGTSAAAQVRGRRRTGRVRPPASGRLNFDAPQQRLVTVARRASRRATLPLAPYVSFDLLAVAGVDVRSQRWTTHRRRLESLGPGRAWFGSAAAFSPVTRSLDDYPRRAPSLADAPGTRVAINDA